MEQYVIALKRSKWPTLRLADALVRLEHVEGFRIIGETSGVRTLIEANDEALDQIQSKLADCCYVEQVIEHLPQ